MSFLKCVLLYYTLLWSQKYPLFVTGSFFSDKTFNTFGQDEVMNFKEQYKPQF